MEKSFGRIQTCNRAFSSKSVVVKLPERHLADANVDTIKIVLVVKKISLAFNDHRCILPAWNCQPSLFNFHGSIDRLINAKFLAAIHRLNYIQANELNITEIELYYVWLLFLKENKGLSTNLFSLQSFSEFQKTWKFLNDKPLDENILKDESKLAVDDRKEVSNQLNINYHYCPTKVTQKGYGSIGEID